MAFPLGRRGVKTSTLGTKPSFMMCLNFFHNLNMKCLESISTIRKTWSDLLNVDLYDCGVRSTLVHSDEVKSTIVSPGVQGKKVPAWQKDRGYRSTQVRVGSFFVIWKINNINSGDALNAFVCMIQLLKWYLSWVEVEYFFLNHGKNWGIKQGPWFSYIDS